MPQNYLNAVQQLGGVSRRMCCDRELKTQSLALFNNSFVGLTMTILQEVEVSSKEKAPKINALKPGGLNFERVEGDGG